MTEGGVGGRMGAKQRETPIFSGLARYAQQGCLPFHVPGHKRGLGMDGEFRAFMGAEVLAFDVTNIDPPLTICTGRGA